MGRYHTHANWPGGATVAVSFLLNYEEGGERSVDDGNANSATYLVPEIASVAPLPYRNYNVENLFVYGSRAGFWHLPCLFDELGIPFTA